MELSRKNDAQMVDQLLQVDQALSAREAGKSSEEVQAAIEGLVKSYIGGTVATDVPLAQQGLDSLAAMELRQKLQVSARP